MTEAELLLLVREKFPDPAYAFLPHVADGTGGYAVRTADAVVMGVWPSRGLELMGIECKCSRQDWRRELKNPAKAEGIAKYMDRWWLVVSDKAIVFPGELPPTWGLMSVAGGRLRVQVEAPKLEPKPVNRSFLAALFRNAGRNLVTQDGVRDLLHAEYARGVHDGARDGKLTAESNMRHDSELRKAVEQFEAASGIRIRNAWGGGKEMGEIVRWLMDHNGYRGVTSVLRSLDRLREATDQAVATGRELPGFRGWQDAE